MNHGDGSSAAIAVVISPLRCLRYRKHQNEKARTRSTNAAPPTDAPAISPTAGFEEFDCVETGDEAVWLFLSALVVEPVNAEFDVGVETTELDVELETAELDVDSELDLK